MSLTYVERNTTGVKVSDKRGACAGDRRRSRRYLRGAKPRYAGGFVGLSLGHAKGHLARAVLEGVVFDLRHSLDCFAEIGLPIDELRIGEGGSHSAVWRQIQADILGRDVVRLATDDLSAVGAALLAETVRCDPERVECYRRAFAR